MKIGLKMNLSKNSSVFVQNRIRGIFAYVF